MGRIPADWKTAHVTAIFKKGTKSTAGNYRPVSLTCVLCKVLESIIRDAMVNHMNDHKLYSSCQHGFRKGRSCTTQLLEVMENLSRSIDDGQNIDILYLDFRKAFDQVPHHRLLLKLRSYGFVGNISKWIEDFLSDRTQKVRVGDSYSANAKVLSGIPQGSILGPILFTVYINDLPHGISSSCKNFADDTKIFDIANNYRLIQQDMKLLQTWSNKWLLYFNAEKCKVLHVGRTNQCYKYSMEIEENVTQEISKCTEEKDLGVIFDNTLSFDAHINNVINKATRMTGIIRRTFSYLNKTSFTCLYKAMIRPIVEYGNEIWSPQLIRQSSAIEKVQRRATKLINDLKYRTYEDRMRHLSLPSLKYRRMRGDMILVFKILNGLIDMDWREFFIKATATTRHSELKLYIKFSRTNTRKYTFSNRTAPIWNSLTGNTKSATSVNNFKNLLDRDPNFKRFMYSFDN